VEGRLTKGGKRIMGMAAGAGLRDGYRMPVEVRRGDVRVVSYQGERLDHNPMVQAALTSYGQIFARIGQRMQDGKKSVGGRLSGLSRQQILILELAGRGLTNADIATNPDVATKTIEYHLWRAHTHFGAADTEEATAALREGGGNKSED
jgi:DNA-binding NarL/FixJ family response regulator